MTDQVQDSKLILTNNLVDVLEEGKEMRRKLGVIIISSLILTVIIGGCGAKKEATTVSPPENGGMTTQQATNGQSSVATEQASLQKIDTKTPQGQAEVDKGLDQKMQSLDSALDKLDKSMGSL